MGGGIFVKVENVFFVKSGKLGCFCKKVENGFFLKSGPFLNAGCIMYNISIFYFIFYSFGGAYAPNAPPAYTCLVFYYVCSKFKGELKD